jgi:DNA uptake protein ComE-like DNA-binding protein
MIDTTKELYEDTKKSLESLLHEKAYSDVQESLEEKGININDVSDEDIETLVAAKAQDMMNGIKGFSVGTAFALALSLLMGV